MVEAKEGQKELFLIPVETPGRLENRLPGVETTSYQTEVPPIGEMPRDNVVIRVHRFAAGYGLYSPCEEDQYPSEEALPAGRFFEQAMGAVLNRDDPEVNKYVTALIQDVLGGQITPEQMTKILAEENMLVAYLAALPGASAASKYNPVESIIKYTTARFGFPGPKDKYGLDTQVAGSCWAGQLNELWFNDGSAQVCREGEGGLLILDYPLEILKKWGLINTEPFRRIFLGRTADGRNIVVSTDKVGAELETEMEAAGVAYAFSNPYALIQDGQVLPPEELLVHSNGDPRHNVRIPYDPECGPIGLETFTHEARMHPEKLRAALLERRPITLNMSSRWQNIGSGKTREAFANDPVYGPAYAEQITFNGGKIILPGLLPACYNFLFTGLNEGGQIVVIQISGRKGGKTGWGGLTRVELQAALLPLQAEYKIKWLLEGCHGRDVDNIETFNNGQATDHTVLSESPYKANQDAFDRGSVTSPRSCIRTSR